MNQTWVFGETDVKRESQTVGLSGVSVCPWRCCVWGWEVLGVGGRVTAGRWTQAARMPVALGGVWRRQWKGLRAELRGPGTF